MKNRKLIDLVVNNWPAKALSVLAAILLSLFYRNSRLEERFFSIPLSVQTETSLAVSSSYPRMVRVTLRGEAKSIHTILEEDIEAYLDLTGVKAEGSYRSAVTVRKKGTALGVDPLAIKVDPQDLSITLEQKLSKMVSLTPNFRGALETGYELAAYNLEPPAVEISGPRSLIEKVQSLDTDLIELSGRRADFTVALTIVNRENLLTVQGSGQTAFRATVRQSLMERTLTRVPLVISGLADGLIAWPTVVSGSVRLEGARQDLEAYIPDASLLSVNCSSITGAGSYTVPVIVSAPANFNVINFEPANIVVQVEMIQLEPTDEALDLLIGDRPESEANPRPVTP